MMMVHALSLLILIRMAGVTRDVFSSNAQPSPHVRRVGSGSAHCPCALYLRGGHDPQCVQLQRSHLRM